MCDQPVLDRPARRAPLLAAAVHYVSHGTPVREDGSQAYPGTCRAAIVTDVGDCPQQEEEAALQLGRVSLCVLNPGGVFFPRSVLRDEDGRRGGTWHWPSPACEGQEQPDGEVAG